MSLPSNALFQINFSQTMLKNLKKLHICINIIMHFNSGWKDYASSVLFFKTRSDFGPGIIRKITKIQNTDIFPGENIFFSARVLKLPSTLPVSLHNTF